MNDFQVIQARLSDKSLVWNVEGLNLRFAAVNREHAAILCKALNATAWIEATADIAEGPIDRKKRGGR